MNGKITVTDPEMTRFWLTLEQGVRFVIRCIEQMHGGEVFVPKIPSMSIMELVKAISDACRVEVVGIRPGEKVHEILISEEEIRQTLELDDMYIIKPAHPWWKLENYKGSKPVPHTFRYSSNSDNRKLTVDELREMIAQLEDIE